jgi:hypothetical protein
VFAVDQHDIQEADQGMMPAADDRPEFAHLLPMLTSLPSVLTERQRLQAREVIFNNADVFSRNEFDLGRTHLMEHRIYTGDAAPVAEPLHRHAQVHEKFLENHIKKYRFNRRTVKDGLLVRIPHRNSISQKLVTGQPTI